MSHPLTTTAQIAAAYRRNIGNDYSLSDGLDTDYLTDESIEAIASETPHSELCPKHCDCLRCQSLTCTCDTSIKSVTVRDATGKVKTIQRVRGVQI